MPNDKRVTFRVLGALMETVNVTPTETRKTMWHAFAGIGVLIVLWNLPELLAVLLK